MGNEFLSLNLYFTAAQIATEVHSVDNIFDKLYFLLELIQNPFSVHNNVTYSENS